MKKLTLAFVVLFIMLIISNAAFSQLKIIYTVSANDAHLSDVAGKVYSESVIWPVIWETNQDIMSSPYDLSEGMQLVIPECGTSIEYTYVDVYYTVIDNDESLQDIANIVYGNSILWPSIWEANKDKMSSVNDIYTGLILDIPTLSENEKEEYIDKYEKYKKYKKQMKKNY